MNTKQVAIKQSDGLLRQQMNRKVAQNLKEAINNIDSFLSEDITDYKSLDQLSIKKADAVLRSAINQYLGAKDKDPKTMSSVLAKMGGSTFQNLRIYRDIIYTKQTRQQRLLSTLKAQLYKAKANKIRNTAYL